MLAVVGDIHGCITTFKRLFYTVNDKYLIHRFIILGDFIDRGRYSKEVTEFLIELQGKQIITVLRGNHEDMLISFLDQDNRYPHFHWYQQVGLATVASFMGISEEEVKNKSEDEILKILMPYRDFFHNTKEVFVERVHNDRFLFSHAGPAFFYKPLEEQYNACSLEEKRRHYPFLWHNKCTKYDSRYYNYTIVYSHPALVDMYSRKDKLMAVTPSVKRDMYNNIISINIGTGCCYGGKLTAMIIDEDSNCVFESFPCED